MLALLVAATLTATPAPRVHSQADVAVFIPRLDKLASLVGFFERAGEKAGLLRPSAWKSEFHPLLWVDVQRVESFRESGISLEEPYTVSLLGNSRMACGGISDLKLFEEKVAARLSALGERFEKPGKTKRVGAKLGQHVRGGYAVRGNQVCAFTTEKDGNAFMAEAVKRVEKTSAGPAAAWMGANVSEAPLYVLSKRGLAALSDIPNGLKLQGRTRDVPVPAFVSRTEHPQGGLAPSGLLFARGAVKPEGLSAAVGVWVTQISKACPACPKSQLKKASDALAAQLTGAFVMRVDRGELRGALQTEAQRFFAVKQALLAQLKGDGATLVPFFESLGKKSEEGYVLNTPSGDVRFGVKGKNVFFANDEVAMKSLLEGASSPGPQEHGLEVKVSPQGLAKTLAQVSLLDVMAVRELASVFAVSAELGPLLAASDAMTLTDDVQGDTHAFELRWTLPERPQAR